jgi:hypothetical protein
VVKDQGTMNSAADEWIPALAYQERDMEIIDYQIYRDEETGLWLRGPRPVSVINPFPGCCKMP